MNLTLYQVDAFADALFKGNPAAVVPLDAFLETQLMQDISMENNVSETAFFCPSENPDADYNIRWFTPTVEINLCGHATLGSAYVLYNFLGFNKDEIRFESKSGILKVRKDGENLMLNFPSWKPERLDDYPSDLAEALGGVEIVGVYKKRDLLVELMNEDAVKKCAPNFTMIKQGGHKIIITAPGKQADFVSRFFAPSAGIDEDPATGSAHSQLIPFWSEKLGKKKMIGKQLSQRGATFICEQVGDRVMMGGTCKYYMKGEIVI